MNTFKRIIASLIVMIMAAGMICATVKAEDSQGGSGLSNAAEIQNTSGDYTYEVVDGTATITAYNGDAAEVNIPDTLGGYTVTALGDSAFADCPVRKVSIPSSVTSIGNQTFYNCYFMGDIELPSGLTDIGNSAFIFCSGLTDIEIPSGLKSIEEKVFYGCSGLTGIGLPAGLTNIGKYAFGWCESLTDIGLPSGLTSIGDMAFYGCSGLTSIELPSHLTDLGIMSFYGCKGLTGIRVAENNAVYDSRNNCNAVVETESDTLIVGCKKTVIPKDVTGIGEWAFEGCSGLTSITIPDSVTSIEQLAFGDCSGLTSITIPQSVTSVGFRAFDGCSNLTSIKVAGNNAVYDSRNNCNAIIETDSNTLIVGCKKTVIPNDVTSIGKWVFGNCYGLTSITIPKGVTSIGDWAFLGCKNLTDVYYEGTKAQWSKIDIGSSNECLTNATIHYEADKYNVGNAKVTLSGVSTLTSGAYWTTYNGSAKKPTPTVKLGSTTLKNGTDYSVKYTANTNVGTATVTVSGKGDYFGTASISFMICFKDVPATHSYQKAVYWAVDNGIAAGYSGAKAGTFGVGDDITRGQVVMFLWRAAGKPEPKSTIQKFTDVPKSNNFFKAVQWASEQGIAGGYSGSRKGQFGPNDNCTRGQIAMFLWRYAGNPAIQSTEQKFTDVPPKNNFFTAVQWAAENGIAAGYKDGTFGVNKTCTRGHCVTFLYRLLN